MNNNVAFVISSLSFGGAEKQAVNDANLLCEENSVFLITFYDGPQISDINKNVKHILIKKDGYLKTIFRLRKIIKKNNIGIIHSSLFASMIITVFASLFLRVNIIWHFHSHEYDIPLTVKFAFVICSRFTNVRIITFVSKELFSDLMKKFYLPVKKTKILYNSGNIEYEKKQVDDKIIIGYLGRIVKLKRINYFWELADYLKSKEINNFEIWIVGDGEDFESVKREVESKNISDYFKFFGFQKNIQYYYGKFDIFILPSQEECLSISLIDAGLAGIPSVAFDVGGNSEIVVSGETGYIVNTLEQLKDKCLMLVNNKQLRLELGDKAKSHCVKNFSKEIRKKNINELNKIATDISVK